MLSTPLDARALDCWKPDSVPNPIKLIVPVDSLVPPDGPLFMRWMIKTFVTFALETPAIQRSRRMRLPAQVNEERRYLLPHPDKYPGNLILNAPSMQIKKWMKEDSPNRGY